jgi:membrane protease YdiL (CAAX protease family)
VKPKTFIAIYAVAKRRNGDNMKKEKSLEKQQSFKAGLLLGGITLFMSFFLLMWSIPDPARFFNHIGFNETAREVPLAWILATIIAIGYIIYTCYMLPTVRQNLLKFNLLKVIGILAAIASGMSEEMVFRQMLMDWLYSNNIGVVLQILISGVAFGVAHAIWALFGGNWRTGVGAAVSTTALGLLLAVVYIVAGRNVLPAIMAHLLINLFIEPWLILHAVKATPEAEKNELKNS